MSRAENARRYRWARSAPVDVNLRNRELAARLNWFVTLRWIAAAAVLSIALVGGLGGPTLTTAPYLLLTVGVGLALANAVFAAVGAGRAKPAKSSVAKARRLLIAQILVDYTTLSVLLYAVGSGAIAVASVFLIHIGLTTLLLPRRISLAVTTLAWCGAGIPFALEWSGSLAPVGRFAVHPEVLANRDPETLWMHLLGVAATWSVAWLLFSVITESLKKSEVGLEDANIRLTTLAQDKARETLRATHELKAPFAAIKSYVYTLQAGLCGELPQKALGVVGRIGKRCDALTEQISELIHLGNLKTLVVTLDSAEPIDFGALVTEAVEEARLLGTPRRIEIVVELGEEQSLVQGERQQLMTLVSNVLRNAVDYSNDAGQVRVSVESTGSVVRLVVADDGIGIPEKNLDRIFDEHFRSTNAARHQPDGTGLGLPIVREIARIHGATVSVQSTPDEGSTFTVEFPRYV